MPSITINGIACEAVEGATLLEAARAAGVRIPTLCYLKDVSAVGSCRVCMVDVEGSESPVPACATVVRDGMAVQTESARLAAYRRIALELLLADHGIGSLEECTVCASDGACELQALCRELGVHEAGYGGSRRAGDAGSAKAASSDEGSGSAKAAPVAGGSVAARAASVVEGNPFLSYDAARCIRCQRCVGACNAAARNHTLRAGKRGVLTTIEAPFGADWRATACESCGNCAQACPTGALSEKRRAGYRAEAVTAVRTTCPHCGVGCQLDLLVDGGCIVDALGAPGPSNKGMLCVKGRSASFDFVDAPDRLRTPLVKNPATGAFEPATWDEALDLVAGRFAELRDSYGGDSLAAFACSRSTNEDVYLFQKMARAAFHTNNVDCCARV